MRLVVGHSMSWTVGGLVVGLAASIGVPGFAGATIFGVTPTDPFVLAAVSLLLLVVAFAASYLPAQACAGRQSGRGAPQSVTRLASLLTLDIGSR